MNITQRSCFCCCCYIKGVIQYTSTSVFIKLKDLEHCSSEVTLMLEKSEIFAHFRSTIDIKSKKSTSKQYCANRVFTKVITKHMRVWENVLSTRYKRANHGPEIISLDPKILQSLGVIPYLQAGRTRSTAWDSLRAWTPSVLGSANQRIQSVFLGVLPFEKKFRSRYDR